MIINHDMKKIVRSKLNLYVNDKTRLSPEWESAIDCVVNKYIEREQQQRNELIINKFLRLRYKERRCHQYVADNIHYETQTSIRYNSELIYDILYVAIDRGIIRLNL